MDRYTGWWDLERPPGWVRGFLVAAAVTATALVQPVLLYILYEPTSPFQLPRAFQSLQLASGAATGATFLVLGLLLLVARRHAPVQEPVGPQEAELARSDARDLLELKELVSGVACQASTLRLRGEGDRELESLLARLEEAAERGSYVARHVVSSEVADGLDERLASALGFEYLAQPGVCRAVLVVDEDPSTRRHFRQVLSPLGFLVLAVPGAELAVDAYESYRREIAMVFVAWDHGGLEGPDAIATLRRLDPELPIFVLSTLELDEKEIHPLLRGPGGILRKPLRDDSILEPVRRWSQAAR
ncbi:MAG: response regulator [Planctomycetota bacterium]